MYEIKLLIMRNWSRERSKRDDIEVSIWYSTSLSSASFNWWLRGTPHSSRKPVSKPMNEEE